MAGFRLPRIAATSLVIAALVGAAVISPLAIDAYRAGEPVASTPVPYSRDAYLSRFQMEQYLVAMGRDPLAWDCRPSTSVRVRYFKNSCFAEHLLEFESPAMDSAGRLRLSVRGEAEFLATDGSKRFGTQYLDAGEATRLVPLLEKRMETIRPLSNDWQVPLYLSAIEACVSGRSYLAVRSYGGDEAYEELASELTQGFGITVSRKSPGACM